MVHTPGTRLDRRNKPARAGHSRGETRSQAPFLEIVAVEARESVKAERQLGGRGGREERRRGRRIDRKVVFVEVLARIVRGLDTLLCVCRYQHYKL